MRVAPPVRARAGDYPQTRAFAMAAGSGTGDAVSWSRLPNAAGLSYKVVGAESEQVRAKVRQFWALVRWQVAGAALSAPPLWG